MSNQEHVCCMCGGHTNTQICIDQHRILICSDSCNVKLSELRSLKHTMRISTKDDKDESLRKRRRLNIFVDANTELVIDPTLLGQITGKTDEEKQEFWNNFIVILLSSLGTQRIPGEDLDEIFRPLLATNKQMYDIFTKMPTRWPIIVTVMGRHRYVDDPTQPTKGYREKIHIEVISQGVTIKNYLDFVRLYSQTAADDDYIDSLPSYLPEYVQPLGENASVVRKLVRVIGTSIKKKHQEHQNQYKMPRKIAVNIIDTIIATELTGGPTTNQNQLGDYIFPTWGLRNPNEPNALLKSNIEKRAVKIVTNDMLLSTDVYERRDYTSRKEFLVSPFRTWSSNSTDGFPGHMFLWKLLLEHLQKPGSKFRGNWADPAYMFMFAVSPQQKGPELLTPYSKMTFFEHVFSYIVIHILEFMDDGSLDRRQFNLIREVYEQILDSSVTSFDENIRPIMLGRLNDLRMRSLEDMDMYKDIESYASFLSLIDKTQDMVQKMQFTQNSLEESGTVQLAGEIKKILFAFWKDLQIFDDDEKIQKYTEIGRTVAAIAYVSFGGMKIRNIDTDIIFNTMERFKSGLTNSEISFGQVQKEIKTKFFEKNDHLLTTTETKQAVVYMPLPIATLLIMVSYNLGYNHSFK